MKFVRVLVGIFGFLLCWMLVAIIGGVAMLITFPPAHGQHVMVGVGFDWRNLPGTVLGLLAGVHSFRASVKEPRQ